MQFMSFETAIFKKFFSIYQLHVRNSKVRRYKCTHPVGNSKWSFFFKLELLTRKRKNEILTIELVSWSEIKYFPTLS